jgi:hypothetical protein
MLDKILRTVSLDVEDVRRLSVALDHVVSPTSSTVLSVKSKFLQGKDSVAKGTSKYDMEVDTMQRSDASAAEHAPISENALTSIQTPASDNLDLVCDIFPCQLRYLDLVGLELKEKSIRMPNIMLVRSEWDATMELIVKAVKGVEGSIIITGQPGIG